MLQRVRLTLDFFFVVFLGMELCRGWLVLLSPRSSLRPCGVRRGRPHGCLRSAEAPGVFLIRNEAGSHYRAFDVELIVSLTPSVGRRGRRESVEGERGGGGGCRGGTEGVT